MKLNSYYSEKEIENFSNYLTNIWSEKKPLCKLLETNSHGYLYDTGTNKLLKCDKLEFIFLKYLMSMEIRCAVDKMLSLCTKYELINILKNIINSIEEENILLITKAERFDLGKHYNEFEHQINNELGMLQLEVTERCNLRCNYCIYNPQYTGKRSHGLKNMSPDTAFRAIDYLESHSNDKDEVSITFYGGEPLLRFSLIKSCVEYARKKLANKKLSFSITTNGTLLTPDMAEYFHKENFGIVVSLDGPKEIHDAWRKDTRGVGSFNQTLSGLKKLYEAYGEDHLRLSLSMVYTPPYSIDRVNRVAELWDEIDWLSKEIRPSITYPSPGSIPLTKSLTQKEIDFSLSNWAKKRFMDAYKSNSQCHPIALSVVERNLVSLMQRRILKRPKNRFFLNGCCVPAVRKLFVTVDGVFRLCERVEETPCFGNIFTGIDIEAVKNHFIHDYAKQSIPYCSNCWAIQLCKICYRQAYSDGKFNIIKKNEDCQVVRILAEEDLRFFCKLLEIDENGLDYLYEWKIT